MLPILKVTFEEEEAEVADRRLTRALLPDCRSEKVLPVMFKVAVSGVALS